MARMLSLLVALLLAPYGWTQQTFIDVNLNAAKWEISNQNGSISLGPVQLPVMVLQALYEAGKLSAGDPILGQGFRILPQHNSARARLRSYFEKLLIVFTSKFCQEVFGSARPARLHGSKMYGSHLACRMTA